VDTGAVIFRSKEIPVISGIALHSQCDGFVLDRILEINNARIKAWGLPSMSITSRCARRSDAQGPADPEDEKDDIPI
jgi:hypothetical protein